MALEQFWAWNRICAPRVLRGQELGQGVRQRFPAAAQKLLQPGVLGKALTLLGTGEGSRRQGLWENGGIAQVVEDL